MSYLNEITVLDFYLDLLDKDKINFLVDRPTYIEPIKKHITDLKEERIIHNKIEISLKLWKVLFESAMTYIDPDKRGYDKLFDYFDKYVQFEELIFASDSFYRDHTMHCLWVYFLGEYIYHKPEFTQYMKDFLERTEPLKKLVEPFAIISKETDGKYFKSTMKVFNTIFDVDKYNASTRCIAALTHDLGYPIKKIGKINKKIKEILPYFSIKTLDEFNFKYDEVQQMHIKEFIGFLSCDFVINTSFKGKDAEENNRIKEINKKLFDIDKMTSWKELQLKSDSLDNLTEEELEFMDSCEHVQCQLLRNMELQLNYLVDFEEYNHGIMSAYLLVKLINSLSTFQMSYANAADIGTEQLNRGNFLYKQEILKAITDHTSKSYQITSIEDVSTFLVLMDELEEFSRISRANKNRQYVNEFCKSNIYTDDDQLCVDFTFDNTDINNLDPEFAFKGRCRRFLDLFRISDLDENLKIRLRCIGDLPYNDSVYELQIRRKYVCILVDNEEKSIPRYLCSNQYYTREEYERL